VPVPGDAAPPVVAIDVTPLVGQRTGIGHSVAGVLAGMAEIPRAPRLVPFCVSARARGRSRREQLPPNTTVLPLPADVLHRLWARGDRPRADRWLRGRSGPAVDVVHGTNYVAPPTRRAATVLTVHDLAAATHPDLAGPVAVRALQVARRATARGAWVHAPSAFTAIEAREHLGSERVVVVPWGVPPFPDAAAPPPALARADRGRPFVLALGAVEPRKGLPALVAAFGGLDHADLHLVLAGPDGPDRERLEAARHALGAGRSERVHVLGAVDEAGRRWLLEHAAVLVYPSVTEGFGFPVLEAMSVGTPVVATAVGAVPEVAGDAALLVPPGDGDALSAAIDRAVGPHGGVLAAAGRAQAARFSWRATAQGLTALYQQAKAAR
jgi:glycosyltransferase involved in cell wall biosynthesis